MGASTQRQKILKTTDAEYEQIIEGIVKARIEADKLDLEYLQRFKKILSPKKYISYNVQRLNSTVNILKIMQPIIKKIKATRDISNFFPKSINQLRFGDFCI